MVDILTEVDEELKVNKKLIWIRKWIQRRNSLAATNGLLRELKFKDPKDDTIIKEFITFRQIAWPVYYYTTGIIYSIKTRFLHILT